MKKLTTIFAAAALIMASAATSAFAQSSGNFDAAINPTVCTLNTTTGTLSPLCTPTANGTVCSLLDTTIKTSNGNGVTLLITPSAVTGLFTNTKISSTLNTATADIGIQVCVHVDGGKVLPPVNTASSITPGDTSCVVYDQRFQQVTNTLFANVVTCSIANVGAPCASDAQCGTGAACVAGACTCAFDLTLSTLSAHSFNFIAQVPGSNTPHHVTATWSLMGVSTAGNATVAACLGPGDVTVTQTKIFNNSGSALVF